MAPRPQSILNLLNEVRNGEVALPDLQRDFVWGEDQIRMLFDSIMRGYPFGCLLLWNTQFIEVVYRDFVVDYTTGQPFVTKVKALGQKMRMVLDGQQRLQSLYVALHGTYDGRRLYFNITSGPGETAADKDDPLAKSYRFEFWRDDAANRPKRLIRVADIMHWSQQQEKAEIKKIVALVGLTGDEAELATDNMKLLRSIMREDILPVETIDDHVITSDQARKLNEILEIFVRVNSGGTPLARSDLMFSLIKTKWVRARAEFDALLADLGNVTPLNIDKDYLIRGLLTVADAPIAFDVEVIERHWNSMEPWFSKFSAALKCAIDFCRAPDVGLISASLLEPSSTLFPVVYYLSRQTNGSVPDSERGRLRTFIYLLLFNRFLAGKSPDARIRYLREDLQKRPGVALPLDSLLTVVSRKQTHHVVTTCDELLDRNKALALNIVQPNAAKVSLSWQDKPELDHIFPQSVYRPIHGELVDNIGNMAFLGKLRNIRKRDQPPWDYFAGISDAELRDDFLITDRSLLAHDKFRDFVAHRRAEILRRVKDFLGR